MQRDTEVATHADAFSVTEAAPSADFIHAISEFLDTDPSDLLVELGYYRRDDTASSE